MLAPRTETILKAIIGQYLVKATPVPSQNLLQEKGLGVSSATIRNEMMRLEQEGYIIRPHTSAGSVPSEKGYRYYVETLKDPELPPEEQRLINHLFHQVELDLEEWLNLAAALLSQMVQSVAVVTMPKPADCRFKYLELVSLQETVALSILVLQGAHVRQQLINFRQPVTQTELGAVAQKLRAGCADLTHSQIAAKVLALSPLEQQVYDAVLKNMETADGAEFEAPYLDGMHFLLEQPEFVRSRRTMDLMEMVEHKGLLQNIIPPGLTGRGVHVIIGKENKAAVVHDLSVVVSRYGIPEEAEGTIGIVGPLRLPYARAISAVDYLAWVLGQLVAELYSKKRTAPDNGVLI
jgi:heat-inducible transcriptional repressor